MMGSQRSLMRGNGSDFYVEYAIFWETDADFDAASGPADRPFHAGPHRYGAR